MEKKNEKKLLKIFGSYTLKFLPLHPLLKMKAARVDILLKETVPGSSFFFFLPPFRQERRRGKRKEKKKKKNFRKYLEDILKSSYLCIRFLKRTAIVKRAIFEQIYINNTSSTRARLFLINGELPWVKQENRQYLFYIGKDKLLNSSVLNR